ncbi:MAG: hypothetical protein DRO23_01105 [Thermoprotei archaeon]|nr:MAG: hypothetical protein DRO23_01105 [Thermoprotei archaeon]
MKKYFSLLIALVVLLGLVLAVIPVQAIITGYRITVSPAKVAPGGIFTIQIEAAAFTGQMFDVYLSTDGYAAGTNLIKKLAEGVKVVDVIVSVDTTDYVNITLMMPEDVEPGTGYYIKITDDGGSTWAVSDEMEVLDPANYYIDFLNGTDVSYVDTIDASFVFNITTAEEMADVPTLKLVVIKEMKLYWIKDYDIIDFATYFPYSEEFGLTYCTVWSSVGQFPLPNPEGKMLLLVNAVIDTEVYVIPGVIIVHPSIEVETAPSYVGDSFTLYLHNFPNETTDGEAINVTKIILTDAAGIVREVEPPANFVDHLGEVSLDGTVPPLQGGGIEDGIDVTVTLNVTDFLEVSIVTASFTIYPEIEEAWVADGNGEFTLEFGVDTEVPGDYVLLNGSGFLTTGETFKVKFYNVSAEEAFALSILDQDLRDDGYAAFLVQLPKYISEDCSYVLNVTGTTDTNFAESWESLMIIPEDTTYAKLFVNPVPTIEGIESEDVEVDKPLVIEGIGLGGYDIANVTAVREPTEITIWKFTAHGFEQVDVDVEKYAVDLGLHEVKTGYFYVETTMPHAPQGTYIIWANETAPADVRVEGISFEIVPTIVTVSPTEDLAPGDTITIVGYGFPENLDVQFIWDFMYPVYVTSDGVGDVSTTLTVPPLAGGLHTLSEPITGNIYTIIVKDAVHEAIMEKLDELATAISELAGTVSGVPASVEEKLGPIASAQEELAGKVSSLEGKVSALESTVGELSAKVDAVSASIGNVMTATVGSAVVVIIVLAIAVFVITRRKP